MACDEWRLKISSWEDGELEGKDEPVLFSHLSSCDECRLFTRRMRVVQRLIAAGRMTPAYDVADDAFPVTEARSAIGFGSALILTAIIASIVAVVMLLATPRSSEAIPQRDPVGNLYGYDPPEQYSTGRHR